MSWEECRLGDVLTLKRGYDLTEAQRKPGDVPVMSSSGITGSHNLAMVKGPGVVTGRYGTMGEVFYVAGDFWPHNTALYVRDFKGNNPRFIAYFLKNALRGTNSNKAAVPGVNRNDLHERKVLAPDLLTQGKVVEQLLPIDEQIENNRRRIALLEQSARLLYREWFVHLRFPGHEHVKVIEGVPEAWSKLPMRDVCADGDGIQTGPFGSQLHQFEYADAGIPVVMPKDLIGFRISTDSIARIPVEVANRLSRHRMEQGDVVYGRRGDIGRRALIGKHQEGYICGTGCLRLRPDPQVIHPGYFFDTLGSPETLGLIVGRAKGSTMPNLNASILSNIPILVPPKALQDEYAEVLAVAAMQSENLTQQNEKLRQARDLLLPRLMSGEIRA